MKNSIKNLMVWLTMMFSFVGCTFEFESHEPSRATSYNHDVEIYYDCYGEPYWFEPDWCDWYDDAECCSWYIDGWYEEWCDWDYDGCWEYSGSY